MNYELLNKKLIILCIYETDFPAITISSIKIVTILVKIEDNINIRIQNYNYNLKLIFQLFSDSFNINLLAALILIYL